MILMAHLSQLVKLDGAEDKINFTELDLQVVAAKAKIS